ncbi:TonB family protein [Methylomonas sp. MgM2]
MNVKVASSKWTQKAYVFFTMLIVAAVINLILLMLIASLINCDDTPREQLPTIRAIEFIRVAQKPPEPKPIEPPPEEKPIEQQAPEKPPEQPKEVVKEPPPKKPVKQAVKKPVKKTTTVAAPKLDIPLDGTGASFASVAGKDSRVTAPPTKWDVEQKPEPPKPKPVNRRLIAVSRVMPVYPWRAKSLGIEGWVKVEIIVATDGTVKQVKVISDDPKDVFGEAAINSIKQWRFKPAFVEGQAVEQRAVQVMEFKLKS